MGIKKETTDNNTKADIETLPHGWQLVALVEVADFTRKPKGINIYDYSKVPFIPMELISENGFVNEDYELKKPTDIKSGTFFTRGDLLVSKITPCFENGKQCIAKNIPLDFGFATTEVWPLKGNSSISNDFLFYLLKNNKIRNAISNKMEGTTGRQRVPKHVLQDTIIPLPTLLEQNSIVHILSTIQQAIEATDKVITAAQELKKSLMQHLFTYGPVSLEETEQIPLKETEMGMIPEHWEIMPLEELVFKSFSGGTPTTKNPEYWNGTINWTTSAYIEGLYLNKAPKNISEIGLKNSSSQIVPKNNIIVGTRVGVGKVAINNIDVAISQDLTGLIIDKSKIELDYLAYALLTDIIQNKFTSNTRGTTIRGISRKDLMQIFVHVPPLQEQKNVAYYLSIVDKRIEVEKDKKVQLQSLFNSMLHHLMTGKLRVKDLDLNIPEEVAQ